MTPPSPAVRRRREIRCRVRWRCSQVLDLALPGHPSTLQMAVFLYIDALFAGRVPPLDAEASYCSAPRLSP